MAGARKASARRPSRSYTPEEVAALMEPLPSVRDVLSEPVPPQDAGMVRVPDWPLPPEVTGELARPFVRPEGVGEMAPVPEQRPRRLVVVARDLLDGSVEERTFVFSPDHGGALVVTEYGKAPDPLWGGGIAGRFSPWSELRLEGEGDARRLVALERTAVEWVERVVPVPEREPPTLLVERVHPDEREGWVLKTSASSFRLDLVRRLVLEDVS